MIDWPIMAYWAVFAVLTAWTIWSGATGRWSNDDWTWMWVFWLAWPLLVFVIPMAMYESWKDRR